MRFLPSILLLLVLSFDVCRAVEPASPKAAGEEPRIFVALTVPDDVADPLMEQQDRLHRKGFKFYRVKREDLHLTLLFLGETPASKVPELIKALQGLAARTPCFDLEHKGLGYFARGEEAKPFVIWGGCGSGWKHVADLADGVSDAAQRVGLPPRRGAFRSHVTLGRPSDPDQGDDLKKDLDSHRELEFGRVHVDRFYLLKTLKNGTAKTFEPLHEFRLEEAGR